MAQAARLWFASMLAWAALGASARANDYYVAVSGSDQNAGTEAAPFASVARAQQAAAAGDTVFIREGVYKFSGTSATIGVAFTKSGTSGKPISYFAYTGEKPIFDLFELKPQARVTGLDVSCNWIHIRGLEVRGVRQVIVGDSWGVRVRGDNNVIEQLVVHDNEAPGIFIASGANNLILNCDSHHNYDPLEDGGNADGFGCHSTGQGNVLRGCRAWENSDDGYDFINASGACTVERSWAMRNGWIPDTNMTGANCAGFKSGGYGNPPNTPASGAAHHVVRFNVAFGNRAIGFYANYHPGSIDFLNNTAFDNPSNFDMRTPSGVSSSHTLRNNIAAGTGNEIVSFNGGTDTSNSWTLPVTVANDDFVNLDTMQAYAERAADGSLPNMTLARLREGSDLIDKGEDLGFAFEGAKPDLGAFEFGAADPVTPPDGGVAGASGGMDSGVGGADGAGGAGSSGTAGSTQSAGGSGAMSASAGRAGMSSMQPGQTGGAAAPRASGGATSPATAGASATADASPSESGGCSCRAGSGGAAPRASMLALCVLFAFVARTRRRAMLRSAR